MLTPAELRADIPALQETTYLNYGAHGPSPKYVVDAGTDFLRDHEYDAPAVADPYETAFDEFEQTRDAVASFIDAKPDEIALTESTTAGINAIAGAIDWQPGDVVVRTDLEHPAGILPWQRLENEGVDVRTIETSEGYIDRDAFTDAVADARLVTFSAITWTHGTRFPVSELVEIAHDAGTLTLVDAVQVPGQTPMSVADWGADIVAAAGHKWLLGLWGSGFLYVDHDVASDLKPRTVGYRSVETPTAASPVFAAGARRFEVGSANPAPHVALREALHTCSEIGLGRIEQRIQELAARLASGIPDDRLLSPREPESGLVTINVDTPAETIDRLRNGGFVLRELPSPNAIRASVHAVNTPTEVDALLDALQDEW
ncbi:putative cysteine desulfurase (plasmid) [Natrialba magadii ATCC 43099]|uniref:Class V aminotransferase n=1 Tax=Natrialba magadii (strain ATCC 43099 / DSM 3394 / CCM 3739 / CIP 104546 / IAM 13178 / JCM 8861 / NBRC 102185 / NCIMB 2190 / MS3) TaxID=547559 RepID=D3T106_NATMM|nr:aminotransferase class V-fold PLP-dependent enzyme [Natrialba magadii]ADD07265.1 putative cysteine desulfurase [Natrialba magadii ATCC 43099]ELY34374.1 class V aminotransferase [Natrialba magadii ATCC 43099]